LIATKFADFWMGLNKKQANPLDTNQTNITADGPSASLAFSRVGKSYSILILRLQIRRKGAEMF
jgi:hypothetical protein